MGLQSASETWTTPGPQSKQYTDKKQYSTHSTNYTPYAINSKCDTPDIIHSTRDTSNTIQSTRDTPDIIHSTRDTPNRIQGTRDTSDTLNSTRDTPNINTQYT